MNPAALKADLGRLEPHGLLIVNSDAFGERDLAKAGLSDNLCEDLQPGPRLKRVLVTMQIVFDVQHGTRPEHRLRRQARGAENSDQRDGRRVHAPST